MWQYDQADWSGFCHYLRSVVWFQILTMSSLDESFDVFLSTTSMKDTASSSQAFGDPKCEIPMLDADKQWTPSFLLKAVPPTCRLVRSAILFCDRNA